MSVNVENGFARIIQEDGNVPTLNMFALDTVIGLILVNGVEPNVNV